MLINTTVDMPAFSPTRRPWVRALDGLRYVGALQPGAQLRRLARLCGVLSVLGAAMLDHVFQLLFQRAPSIVPWRITWQQRWARQLLRAMHVRLTCYGHAPARGLIVSNEAGLLGRIILAAVHPALFSSHADDLEDAIANDLVTVSTLDRLNGDVAQRALQRGWPVSAAWIQRAPVGAWALLALPSVPLTVAVAHAEPARGTATTFTTSLQTQVRLLAHASARP